MILLTQDLDALPSNPWKAAKVATHPETIWESLRRFSENVDASFSGYWAGLSSEPILLFSWGVEDEKQFFSLETFLQEFPWFQRYNPEFKSNSESLSCVDKIYDKKTKALVLIRRTYIMYIPPFKKD
jgi:hypothetical protein